MTILSAYVITPLDLSQEIKFGCGNRDLDDFFINDAKEYKKALLANTYLCTKGDDIVAMFCVSNDSIQLSNRKRKKQYHPRKQLRAYSSVKVGRLGVSSKYQSKGIGSEILGFLKIFFIVRNKTGCRYLSVDAYNNSRTINFYKKNGLDFLTESDKSKLTRTMYGDLLPYYNTINKDKELAKIIELSIKKVHTPIL